jgi:hypothetical protein
MSQNVVVAIKGYCVKTYLKVIGVVVIATSYNILEEKEKKG